MHVKDSTSSGCLAHVFLCLITVGLWIPFAMIMVGLSSLGNTFAGYRCATCGGKSGIVSRSQKTSPGVRLLILTIYAAVAYWWFVLRETQ